MPEELISTSLTTGALIAVPTRRPALINEMVVAQRTETTPTSLEAAFLDVVSAHGPI